MTASGQALRLRLFIEGVEVPVIAATIQTTPNAPAAASIQIPPLAEGTRLYPRSVVHLAFLDVYEGGSVWARSAGGARRGTTPSVATNEQGLSDAPPRADEAAPDVSKYKLLFGGETVGFQWTKNASTRSLVLQCLDWSSYWDYAYQWNNTDLFGPGVKALFSGGSTNLFTDFLSDEGSAIQRILQTPSVQYPRLKGLLGGIVHLLEAIGGSYYYGKKFAGQNIFFSLAELRLHITQMITACETDPTASRLLNARGYDGLFGRVLGGLGEQVSIRDAINALMGVIFHETYAIPTPYYIPSSSGDVEGRTRRSARSDPKNAFVAERADALIVSVTRLKERLSTQALAGDADALAWGRDLALARKACAEVASRIRDSAALPARGYYVSAGAALDRARVSARRAVAGGRPPAGASDSPVAAALDDALAALRRAASFVLVQTDRKATPARLCQQIFRPDVWFSAPPRCNVLFPEHYASLTYARSFLQEPTRLLLKTNDEFFGEDELFDQYYFAPKVAALKTGRNDLAAILSNDLLAHELFTGIVPIFEKMGELNILAARSGTVNASRPKIGLAQRSCNFLYFKYRYAARHLEVSGRFNPYVAPGFPGLILDKYMDAAAAERRAAIAAELGGGSADAQALTGTHFLANFTEVTHSVDQNQGRTDIRCSYPRQPEESVEFLGVTRDEPTVRRRASTDAVRSTDVAARTAPVPGTLGPNEGNVVRVTDVTGIYQASDLASGRRLPLFEGPRRTAAREARIRVPVGLTARASAYGADVAALVGHPSELVRFHAYRIEEDVPRYRREPAELPPEEYIRPEWYGDVWHPSQIGQVYAQFFGTGAITDPQAVETPDGAQSASPDPDAADALAARADDPDGLPPAFATLEKDASIASAIGFLVQIYSHIRSSDVDVEDFLRAYTWRPIASLVDLFGSSDLELTPDGRDVAQGIEGFHSRAFGPYDDLFGLVTPDIDSVLGIARGSNVAQRGDTRKRKQDAVRAYVAALGATRAHLG